MLASAVFALALCQSPKHSLRFVPQPKESWTYNARISADAGAILRGTAKFVFTASEVAADGAWTNLVEMREIAMTVNGDEQSSDDGNEMSIDRDAFGVVKDWNSYEPRDQVGFDATELLLGYAPPAPVAAGESWTGRVPGKSELKPFRFKFEGEERVNGKALLKLTSTGTAPSVGEVQGTLWLSPDRYRVVKFVLASETGAAGKFSLKFDLAE